MTTIKIIADRLGIKPENLVAKWRKIISDSMDGINSIPFTLKNDDYFKGVVELESISTRFNNGDFTKPISLCYIEDLNLWFFSDYAHTFADIFKPVFNFSSIDVQFGLKHNGEKMVNIKNIEEYLAWANLSGDVADGSDNFFDILYSKMDD